MPLKNFGSILNFAAELEAVDHAFYKAAAANPDGAALIVSGCDAGGFV